MSAIALEVFEITGIAHVGGARHIEWCGRPESNRHGVAPNGFSYQLRFSPPSRAGRLWSGLYLHPNAFAP